MITSKDMEELYGRENLVTVPRSDIERFRLRPQDAEVLTEVGLPRVSSPYFTVQLEGGPKFLTVIDVTTRSGKDHREVIIGGPPGDRGMRFSVDAHEGFITLAQLRGTRPRGEVVNNNLSEFIEFLYRIEQHRVRTAQHPADCEESLEELTNALMRIDPISLEREDDWWSIALHQLRGGGVGL
ncbi:MULTISPECIES: SUKH-4 family immunity protein [Streptomyces]|uniref:SUKH-4 family immunity protein n=1 Tax=Streptomyces lonegramiae TaxID=3075524 RepID=A0ABU2XPN7_9ACTN|nr:SUKH-4 family immunity protein [Streptomyces sp. DSM 41529]MDT0547898.1 SUKH-4 family immunity protein [Streptomyces sp. DSM 41529]